jgi:hypothetical protein
MLLLIDLRLRTAVAALSATSLTRPSVVMKSDAAENSLVGNRRCSSLPTCCCVVDCSMNVSIHVSYSPSACERSIQWGTEVIFRGLLDSADRRL